MALNPGETLLNNHYRIVRQIGRGGFGFVYLAEDTLLGEKVAIKELIPVLVGDEAMLKRFLAEARATMRLRHKRIVGTHNVFSEGGNYYIVMEYMPGGSLEERLRERGALPVDEAVQIAVDVCEGLACAHEEGVVHCDLKPHNILFTADDARSEIGAAKVADFGIAHVSGEMLTRSWMTPAGFVAGTLPYMSPEQAEGVRDDPRIDVYAVGAVLYRMLTGRTYLDFDQRETPAAQADNVYRIRNREPEPPSAHAPYLPPWLDGVVLRALAKQPEARYASAEALRAALLRRPAPAEALPPTQLISEPRAAAPTPSPARQAPSRPAARAAPAGSGAGAAARPSPLPAWVWPAGGAVVLVVFLIVAIAALGRGGDGDGVARSATATDVGPTGTPVAVRSATHTPEPEIVPTQTNEPTSTPTDMPRPTATPTGTPCATCHSAAGATHQAAYDELYQEGVVQVTDLAYSFTTPDTTRITFAMTKNGAPFDATEADSLAIYFAPYTGTAFEFKPAAARLPLKGDLACDEAGRCTSTLVGDIPDVSNTDGLLVLYGRDEEVGQLPARVRQTKYPFAALLETGGGIDYVSAANNAGCEKCHTDPYLKHGYIPAQVDNNPATDFYICKACHLDNGEGGHFEWQLLVDDPELAAAFLAGEVELTEEQEAQYAYETSLMNDVHMSHAMEFPYPQSIANCVTCHEGKLDVVLSNANFKIDTCKSCHPMTGAVATNPQDPEEVIYDTTGLALKTVLPPSIHDAMDLETVECTICHAEGSVAAPFNQIHTGYDKTIYTADGLRYSDAIRITVDGASFDGNTLNIQFSAVEATDIEELDVADIAPSVLVGLYGWDTKDYIVGPHERLSDDNGDGFIDSSDQSALEYVVGEEHPRFTTVSAAGDSWEVTADLSAWNDMITAGTVKRVEIAIIPTLANAGDVPLALDAPSRTFDLEANDFADGFYSPIVKVTDGCENCHDALATSYHSPDRGGNVVVCRLCHITKSGASRLEMQSRSIDSYIHAIHSGQAFDIGDIDFSNPVEAMYYERHFAYTYPRHGITDCESCHPPDTNNVSDQSASLPGLLSGSDKVTGWDRNIGDVPAYVTGPASRACGGCHRATLINQDDFTELVTFNQHIKLSEYLIEAGEDEAATLGAIIDQIMAIFK